MTRKDLKKAYDSVNPTQAEKERMLRAILEKAEVKTEKKCKKEPVIYTARPVNEKPRSILPVIAACLAVLILSALLLLRLANDPEDPVHVDPTQTTLDTEEIMAEGPYAEVLKKYIRAVEENWSAERCAEENISSRTVISNEYDGLYYAISDLDGDGVEDLVLTESTWADNRTEFLDIYTLKNGEAFLLASDRQFLRPMLFESGIIMHTDPGQENPGAWNYSCYLRIEGEIFVMETAFYQTEDGQWYEWSPDNRTAEKITEDRAGEIAATYRRAELNFSALVQQPEDDLHTGEEAYDAILQKYLTALLENWTAEKCEEAGISSRTPITNEHDGLYYAISDLDGNGTKELILTETDNQPDTDLEFLDLYSLEGDKPVLICSDRDFLRPALCAGGIVKTFSAEVDNTNHYDKYISLRRINGSILEVDLVVYQIDNQWFMGHRASAMITEEKANSVVKEYTPAVLDLHALNVNRASGENSYDAVLEKYRTALQDVWSDSQCEAEDISPEIPTALPDLGWTLMDLDGNGGQELIVSDSKRVYDIYTIMPEDGNVLHILTAWGSNADRVCENGMIQMQEFYSKGCAWMWFALEGMELKLQDMVFYTNSNAENQYSYGPDSDHLEPIEKVRAGELLNRYPAMELERNCFTEAQKKTVADREIYQKVLDIYGRAASEEWNPGQCMENGISLMLGYQNALIDTWGAAFIDLDNNGTEELLITDGYFIYDLYTIIDDEEYGPVRLLTGTERSTYQLMEGNVIFNRGSGSAAVSSYTYYTLEGRNLVLLEGYLYDGSEAVENPWFYYDGQNIGDRCENMAANDIVNFRYTAKEILFTPFEG